MAENKKRVKGSNSRKIQFNYKQGDPNWRKFDAQRFRFAVSNNFKFHEQYFGRYGVVSRYTTVILILIIVLIIIIRLINHFFDISLEKIVPVAYMSVVILIIVLFNVIVIYKDHKENGELSRIRKYKPGKITAEKKKTKRQKKKREKEDIPWEL